MTKDEEIKRLTDLCARSIDRNGRLNRELKEAENEIKKQKKLVHCYRRDFEQGSLQLGQANKELKDLKMLLMEKERMLNDATHTIIDLKILIEGTLGMLPKQQADHVVGVMLAALRRVDY